MAGRERPFAELQSGERRGALSYLKNMPPKMQEIRKKRFP